MCPYIYEERLRHQPHFSRKWRALFGGGKKCCHNASITGGGLQKGWAQCSNKGEGGRVRCKARFQAWLTPHGLQNTPQGPLMDSPWRPNMDQTQIFLLTYITKCDRNMDKNWLRHFTVFYISLRTKGQRWLVELRAQGRSHLKQSLSRKAAFYFDSSNQYQMVKRKYWRNYF